jgi:hypothetical protein
MCICLRVNPNITKKIKDKEGLRFPTIACGNAARSGLVNRVLDNLKEDERCEEVNDEGTKVHTGDIMNKQ